MAHSSKQVAHRREELLGGILRGFMQIPAPIRAVILFFTAFYSLPVVINVVNAIRAHVTNRLRVYSYPMFVYFFPLLSVGLIFYGLDYWDVVPPEPLGWLYAGLFVYTAITVGLDFKIGSWILKLVAGVAVTAIVAYVGAAYEIPILSHIYDFTRLFGMTFPSAFLLPVLFAMAFVYLMMMVRKRFAEVLIIDGNYVIVKTLLGEVDRNTRSSYALRSEQRDVNEAFLGFCRTLVLDPKSGKTKRHIFRSVPAGVIVGQVITQMLKVQAVEEEMDFEDGDDGDGEE